MKYLYTFLTLLIVSVGFSQEVLEDFEAAGVAVPAPFGGTTTFIADDPQTVGSVNGKVAQGNSASGGEIWQGFTIDLVGKNLDLTTDKTITLDVFSDVVGEFAVKVQSGVDGAPASVKNAAHAGSGWENITVDFSSGNVDGTVAANGAYAQVVIYMNWSTALANYPTTPADKTIYVDNITGVGVDKLPPVTNPTAGPAAPQARDAADVFSLYGSTYTRHDFGASGTFDQAWCGVPSMEEVTLADNQDVVRWKDKDCQGIAFSAADVSNMTNFSVDIFIHDSTDLVGKVFNVKYVQPDLPEKQINFDLNGLGIAKGEWVTLNSPVDLTGYDGVVQFGITSPGNDKMWYTNLYTYRDATASVESAELIGLKLYPNPVKNIANFSANETIQSVSIYDLTGRIVKQATPNKSNFDLDVADLSKGVYLVKLSAGDIEATTKLIK